MGTSFIDRHQLKFLNDAGKAAVFISGCIHSFSIGIDAGEFEDDMLGINGCVAFGIL
jgi:hypothetical protein